MRSIILSTFILLSISSYSQHQAVGLRLGNPTGITYKNYLANSRGAVEFSIGSASKGWNKGYYQRSFERCNSQKQYVSHVVNAATFIQARYLKHYPVSISDVEGKFHAYWGIGLLFKVARVDYSYRQNQLFFPEHETITDIDLGPEIPIGIEYTFHDIPLTVFTEISLVAELTNRVGVMQIKGVLGVQYNFFKKLF